MKEFVRRALRRFDIDEAHASFRQSVADFIADRSIDTVLDVGANVGQFASSLRKKGFSGRLESFEPVSSVFADLEDTARHDAKWHTHNYALGAATERTNIHVSDSSVFSLLLTATDAAHAYSEASASTHTEEIEVRTLDDVLPVVTGDVLLKIDTQGFEKRVLDGGRRALPHLKGVLMELPIIQLYECNWQFHEAIAYMAESGFVPAQVHPVNFHSVDKVSLVEVDCLFRPQDPLLDAHCPD